MRELVRRYSKQLAALAGTATPAGVLAVAAEFGWELPIEAAGAVVVFLGAASTVLAPKNDKQCGDCPASACENCPR